ncbi:MAG: MYG1 family protein [Candidatus Taylorbacteria bacterium]|nr:MYG1 family protein [Candidatus Taylorbacteria bacterium]
MVKAIVTHSGDFHTDDVFAVAALFSIYPQAVIIRTRDKSQISKGDIVVDVGGIYHPASGRFDHHQTGGAGGRENGVPYAAFGLVWKHFGEKLCPDIQARRIVDERLVQPIDCFDNGFKGVLPLLPGVYPYRIEEVVCTFHPTWKENKADTDGIFLEVLILAQRIIEREITRAMHRLEAEGQVVGAYGESIDKRLIVLDEEYPFQEVLTRYPEPIFVVHPDKINDTWNVRAVRERPREYGNRKDFPKEWAGMREMELARVSGVNDAIFCHNKLFLAAAKSKEGAIKLAKLALAANI